MKPPVQYVEVSPARRGLGCSLGCFGIGCLIIVVGLIGLVGLGYYAMMYTSLPLRLMEQALEKEGNVEIEGLEGSLASGIKFDSLKIKAMDDKWSEFHGVKVDYSGFSGINIRGNRSIDQFTVDSATIYAEIEKPESFIVNFSGLRKKDLFDENNKDFRAFRRAGDLMINNVAIGTIKLINPKTGYAVTIDRVTYSGFHFKHGKLIDPGDLRIESDIVNVKTVNSPRWAESPNSKRFWALLAKGFLATSIRTSTLRWTSRRAATRFEHTSNWLAVRFCMTTMVSAD